MIRPFASTNHFSLENDLPASVAAIHSSNSPARQWYGARMRPP